MVVTPSKTTAERQLARLTTAELKQLTTSAIDSPQRLGAIYFELQFRNRKAARELRSHIRAMFTSIGKPFPWPTTDAPTGANALRGTVFRYDRGLLKLMGYRVGVRGIGEAKIRDILDDIYVGSIPTLRSVQYQVEWGQPHTSKRLKKLADTIATLTRNAKRKKFQAMSEAISEWEADLGYLKRQHYDGYFNFPWPEAGI